MRFALPVRLRFAALSLFSSLALCVGAAAQVQFQQPKVVPTGNWPVFVATADVNADGIPDLIYIDAGATAAASTTHVLLGDGKGGFKQSAQIATAGSSIAIGDLTGNHQIDIGWLTAQPPLTNNTSANNMTTVYVAAGDGTGRFAAPVTTVILGNVPTPIRYGYLTAAQLSASGPMTLLAEDLSNNILAAFNNPLPAGQSAALPDGTGPISVADLNGDGKLDVIVNGTAAQVFLNDRFMQSGVLVTPTSRFSGLTGVHSLLLRDVNQDGEMDLIVEGAAGHIDVFFGNGDGTFQATSAGGTGPLDGTTGNGGHLIAAADLNGDGQLDAIAATPAGMSVLLGGGLQYLKLGGIYNAGPGHTSYATADFNGDGNLDVAVDSPEGIAILYSSKDGSLQSSKAYAAGQPALSGVLGKFTASGHLDAVVSTGALQAQVLLGAGDGSFAAVATGGVPTPTTTEVGMLGLFGTVAVGDFDGDGKLDIAMTQDGGSQASYGGVLTPPSGSGLSIQYGNGDGTFGAVTPLTAMTPPEPISTGCTPIPFAHFPGPFFGTSVVGDFNGDGITDIANLDPAAYRVMFGNASRASVVGFSDIDGTATEVDCDLDAHDYVVAGDLNGDGKPDFIFQDEGDLEVYLNPSTGNFTHVAEGMRYRLPGAPNIASDFLGNSNTYHVPTFIGSIVIADLNGDGKADVIATYDDLTADHQNPSAATPNRILIWMGNGDGTFQAPAITVPSRNYYQVAVVDLNGDGIPDLVMSDGYILNVQYGKGDGTFGAENHFLAGQGLNTISVGDVNGDGSLDLVVANGGAVFGNPVANKEVFAINPDVNTGGITVLLNAIKTSTVTGSLTATPEPSAYAGAFTVTAALTAPVSGAAPTGMVAFSVDGNAAGTADVVNNTATLAVPPATYATLIPGKHALSAQYSGDANYTAVMLAGSHTVSLAPTSVTLKPTTLLTIYYGQAIDGTFFVNVVDPTNHPATGTYTLDDNGVDVPICTSLPLTATCPYGNPVLLNTGVHAFTVKYLGDAFNAPSVSAPVVYTVLIDLTKAVLTTSASTVVLGQPVTLTDLVTGNYATPTGPVTFLDGSSTLTSGALDGTGTAALTTSTLTLGLHTISAVYPATLDFNAATSNAVTVLVTPPVAPAVTAVTLVSSVNPSTPGQPVTFSASVTTPGPFVIVPTGSVTFLDGTTALGTGTLDGYGVARYTTSSLATGSHSITASFAGDAGTGTNPPHPGQSPALPKSGARGLAVPLTQGLAGTTSAVLIQVVTNALPAAPAGFVLTVSPVPVTIGIGRTAVLLVNVTALSGFSESVALTCSGLPTESACTFAQPTIPAGGGSTTLEVSTMAPHDCDAPGAPYLLGSNGAGGGMMAASLAAGLAIFLVPGKSRRRRWLKGLLALVAVAGLSSTVGCGRCTDLGTRPGTYTFAVTGTASSQTQSQVISLTVTIP